MMMKQILLIVGLMLLFTSKSFSHGEHVAIGAVLSFPFHYNFNDNSISVGTNIDGIFGPFNASVEHSSIFYGADQRFKGYLGLGLGPLIQVQYGFHSALRIRSDIVIFGDNSPAFSFYENKWGFLREGIVISPIVDFNFRGSKTTEVSIGIGVYL
jgi:hypothetical protein